MALSDRPQPEGRLSNQAGMDAHALFYDASRTCQRCNTRNVRRPDRVQWGADAVEWHLCPDGEYGVLTLDNPPPGREVRDAAVVDFDMSKEDPR